MKIRQVHIQWFWIVVLASLVTITADAVFFIHNMTDVDLYVVISASTWREHAADSVLMRVNAAQELEVTNFFIVADVIAEVITKHDWLCGSLSMTVIRDPNNEIIGDLDEGDTMEIFQNNSPEFYYRIHKRGASIKGALY